MCLVAWSLNKSEAGVDLAWIETSLLLCKFPIISIRTAHRENRQVSIKTRSTPASLSFKGQQLYTQMYNSILENSTSEWAKHNGLLMSETIKEGDATNQESHCVH